MNPTPKLKSGHFLIASPDIIEGLFFRSVMLLCEHSPSGSFGLIINKILKPNMPEEISKLGQIANPHITICAGGPMQPDQMMLLHNCEKAAGETLQLCPKLFLGGELPFLQKAILDPNGPNLHLCFGYSGWSAGLLEKEYLSGNWFIHKACAEHVFKTPPNTLWRTLLKEMGGKYASLASIPDDLSLN